MTRSPATALASNRRLATNLIDDCLDPPAPDALWTYTDNQHVLAVFAAFAQAFPDARMDVEWIAAAPDRVAMGGRISATHAGPWRNVAGSGRPVVFATTLMVELDGDRVVDLRTVTDSLAVAEQIGAVPTLGPPACKLPVPHGAPEKRFINDEEGPT